MAARLQIYAADLGKYIHMLFRHLDLRSMIVTALTYEPKLYTCSHRYLHWKNRLRARATLVNFRESIVEHISLFTGLHFSI